MSLGGRRDGEWRSGARGFALALLIGVASAPVAAAAAEAPIPFDIPAQPLASGLVAFGRQASASVGVQETTGCGRRNGQAVVGSLTRAAALNRLLDGSGCTFVALDSRAFRVEPEAAKPAARPAAETREQVEPEGDLLLDVVVTTSRRPSLLSQTPASVSVAPSFMLGSGRSEGLQDLAPEFAGVSVTNLGPGRNKVFIRGLSDGAFNGRTQSIVGLYLDDVPITYNTPDPDLRLTDIERVELMRGPQGPLYGVGSMGGIVRVVTGKVDLAESHAGFAVEGAATRSGAPSYALDAMLNAPILKDRLGIRAVAYAEARGGYVDDIAMDIKDANRTRRVGGRFALSAAPSPDWRLTLGATRQSLRTDDSQYVQGSLGRFGRDGLVREPHKNDFSQAYLFAEGQTSLGDLRLTASLLDHRLDSRFDASNGLFVFGSEWPVKRFNQKNHIRLALTEAVLTSRRAGRLQWLAGVFASRTLEHMKLDLSQVEDRGDTSLYLENRHDRLGEVAAYGEVSYDLTRKLRLTGGLRGFRAWLHTDSTRFQGVIERDFEGALTSTDISPKLELSWQTAPTRLFYLQAAQGYRMGGFNTTGRVTQQFNAGATGNQPNRRYSPDKVWSYEVGAKVSFGERRFDLRTSLFYTDWQDVQSDQFLPSGLPYTANVGRAVNSGFEGEVAWRAAPSLALRLNFLVAGPQLTKRDPTYPSRPNASLPAVPKVSSSLIVDWRREFASDWVGVFYGRLAYVGASTVTFQDQAASSMGNYVTARLSAGVEHSGWRMSAYVDNPADVEGETFAFGDPFTQGRERQSTPLRPRTVGFTLARGL